MREESGIAIGFRRTGVFLLAVGFLFSSAFVSAQSQPQGATNAQDEYVHIGAANADEDGVLTIFRSGDKSQVRRYFSNVVELKHAYGFEVVPHVLKAVKLEGGTARTLKYKDESAGKTRNFIQVVTTEKQMPSVLETIRALDLPGVTSSEGDLKYAVRMRYRRASEVADILSNTTVSGEGEVHADDVSNTVWIKDSVSDGERDIAYVSFYDVPPPQVEFDVQVIEVTENDVAKLGLDWDAWKRSLSGDISVSTIWNEGSDMESHLDSLLTLDAEVLADFLNYTVQSGSARTVNRARVTASNAHMAAIQDTRPVLSLDEKSEGSGSGPSEGLTINITPTIGTDLVTAAISVKANVLDSYDALQKPVVSSRDIQTIATLEDGKPFLLGSVRREIESKFRSGIPGLRNIWLLKYLFSVEANRKVGSRVFIIATPKFQNQVRYDARTITSAEPEVDPPVTKSKVDLPQDAQNEHQAD